MRRHKMGRKHSRKLFRRTASKSHGFNYGSTFVMRGGIRL